RGHDALAPVRLRQPIPDFGPVRWTELKVVEATASDQKVVFVPDRPMDRLTLLLSDLADEIEPVVGVGFSVRIGDAERALVDVLFLQMLEKRQLVGGPDFREMNAVVDEEFHHAQPSPIPTMNVRFRLRPTGPP